MSTDKLFVVTQNLNKIAEIQQLIPTMQVDAIKDDVEETGCSFEENARIKVAACTPIQDALIIADDSGLEVDALGGAPGIYSARYAGPGASDIDLCSKLLANMAEHSNRHARFRCAIAVRFPDERIEICQGCVDGYIHHTMAGSAGFGYDSVFIPVGYTQTFAQLGTQVKHQISHRARALEAFLALL